MGLSQLTAMGDHLEDAQKASPTIPEVSHLVYHWQTVPRPITLHSAFQIPCTIDDFGEDNFPTIDEMFEFWDTSREWLRLRGVQLYDLRPENENCMSKVWHTPLTSTQAVLPYARCISYEGMSPKVFWTAVCNRFHAGARRQVLILHGRLDRRPVRTTWGGTLC